MSVEDDIRNSDIKDCYVMKAVALLNIGKKVNYEFGIYYSKLRDKFSDFRTDLNNDRMPRKLSMIRIELS